VTRAHAGLQVDKVNEQRLKDLVDAAGNPEPSRFFQAVDEGQSPYLEQIKKNCLAPFTLELKKGAQARPRPAPRRGAGVMTPLVSFLPERGASLRGLLGREGVSVQ